MASIRSSNWLIRRSYPPLLALLLLALSCTALSACGSSNNGYEVRSVTPANSYLASDEDADNDDKRHPTAGIEKTDTLAPSNFGERASPADRAAIAALIKRYYVAAANEDGIAACPLLYSTLAAGLEDAQSQPAGNSNVDCGTALSSLFAQQHGLLVAEQVTTAVVIGVNVKGNLGRVTVGFRTSPVGEMLVKRERDAWKLDTLFDTGMN